MEDAYNIMLRANAMVIVDAEGNIVVLKNRADGTSGKVDLQTAVRVLNSNKKRIAAVAQR